MANRSPQSQQGSTPVPDPTLLTTQALEKSISSLKELTEAWIKNLKETLDRLQREQDSHLEVVVAETKHLRELIGAEVGKLTCVTNEKFARVDMQFAEMDKRNERQFVALAEAAALALQAQKDLFNSHNQATAMAVSKSEAGMADRISQLQALFDSDSKAKSEKIDDIRTRLNTGESRSKGASDLWGYIIGGVGLLVAIISIVILILNNTRNIDMNRRAISTTPTIVEKSDGTLVPLR
jgi:hypothetical protein